MAAAPDLLYVYKRIMTRVEDGNKQFDKLNRIFLKRAEVYEKTAKNLQELFTLEYDENDLLESSIMKEIKNEAKMYSLMSDHFKSQILGPTKTKFEDSIKQAKKMNKHIEKECCKLEKVIKQCNDSLYYYNDMKKKITESKDAKKRAKLVAKAKILSADYDEKIRIATEEAVSSQSTEMPKIHKFFSEQDSMRMVSMWRYSLAYIDLKMKMNNSLEEVNQKIYNQFMSYDAKDRSSRYVTRCFDPTIKASIEDEEMYVVAINDYRSEQAGDLSFKRGDKIKVLLQHSSGWWDGEFNGVKGTFPKTYVQVPKAVIRTSIPMGANFFVDKNYKAKSKVELDIDEGDVIYVDYIKNGKANGTNLRTNRTGTFPESLLTN